MNEETYTRLWKQSRSNFPDVSPVNFFPAVGKDYFNSPVRILALGHSHYASPQKREMVNAYHQSTMETVMGYYMQRRWQRNYFSFHEMALYDKFEKTAKEKADEIEEQKSDPTYRIPGYWKNYRKMGNIVCNQPYRVHTCDYIWDSMAFYNYFQKVVGTAPRKYEYLEQDRPGFKKEAELAFFGLENGQYSCKSESVMGRLAPNIVIVWGGILYKDMPEPDGTVCDELKNADCFAYKEFPDTIFIRISHPASSKWNSEVRGIYQRFSLLRKFYPIEQLVENTHASSFQKVESLAKAMKRDVRGYGIFWSEVAYTCRLFEIQDGVAMENAPRSMYLEASYESENCIKIRFYTQDFKKETAWSILESPEFDVDQNVLHNEFEGRYTLETLPANSSETIVVEKMHHYMKKMKQWRDYKR